MSMIDNGDQCCELVTPGAVTGYNPQIVIDGKQNYDVSGYRKMHVLTCVIYFQSIA